MSMNGKYFRPPPQKDESSEEDEDSSEDEGVQPQNQPGNADLSSEMEDDDAEGKDEGEEEDGLTRKRRRENSSPSNKKYKTKGSNFFDEEAEDCDEEPEEDGTHHDPHDVVKHHYTKEDRARENMDDETREIIRQQNERRNQTPTFSGDMDVANVTQQLEGRYATESRVVDPRSYDQSKSGGDYGQPLSAVSQQSLLPSVNDPTLWMFGCPHGKEQELVYQIMNKCISFASQGKPLGITSAVAAQTKGRVYVECTSESSVIEAVQGIRNLLSYSMKVVPISDMTTVMTVIPKKNPVRENEWVRLTRGQFKGDLALVRKVESSGLRCVIQCVPRLDLAPLGDLTEEEKRIRRKTVRPPQRMFNETEIPPDRQGVEPLSWRETVKSPLKMRFACCKFENNYYHDGYLLKLVTVATMVKTCSEDEPPTLDELRRFRNVKGDSGDGSDRNDDDENEGSKIAKSLLDEISDLQGQTKLGQKGSNKRGLLIGDTIEVVEGDLVGMRGKLLSIDGLSVKVKPINADDLGDTTEVEFLASQVKKLIAVGAHVKVSDGRYANETGVVVAVEQLRGETDSTAVILTDMTHKEISVCISQLQESAEVASGQDKLAGYELHDLVVLSGSGSTNEIGVIVRVGREEFTVINNHGIIREVRPEELRGKRNLSSDRAVALDAQGNQIRCADTVNVAEGPHKGKVATIKRMFRAQLFLYSQTRTENAGIFVVRSRSCVLTGAGMQGRANVDVSTQQNTGRSAGPAGVRGKRDDGLLGKTVRIQAGQWKGYLGCVADTTLTHVQVELHSRLKKVMVVHDRIQVVGDKFGATEDQSHSNNQDNMMAPSTPFIGGATPIHGGATPMHGSATPMHDSMGGNYGTPSHSDSVGDVWRPGGSIDRSDESEPSNVDGSSAWGTTSESPSKQGQSDPFSQAASESSNGGGGWGSSNDQSGSGWTPASDEKSQTNDSSTAIPVKQETLDPGDNSAGGGESSRGGASIDATPMDSTDGEEAPKWFMERVCVLLKKNDLSAVIKEVINNTAVIELKDNTSMTVRAGEILMEAPKEHDTVLVTGGADVGVEGELVCIDGSDAILKDSNEDFKIVDFIYLAKIISDA